MKLLKVRADRAPKIEWLESDKLDRLWDLYESGALEGSEKKAIEIFLFCCYTGIAYIDYALFNPGRFEKEQSLPRRVRIAQPRLEIVNDMQLIVGNRVKSNTTYCKGNYVWLEMETLPDLNEVPHVYFMSFMYAEMA